MVVFACAGGAFASWAARIPDLKDQLGLDPRGLGVLLFAGSFASLVVLPLSGHIAHRLGATRAIALGATTAVGGMTVLGLGVTVASTIWLTAIGLFVTGAGIALWDVSMNLEGAYVERGLGRSVMPHYHAAFSGGTVVAALLAAALVGQGVPVVWHLVAVGSAMLGVVAFALRHFREPSAVRGTAPAEPSPGSAGADESADGQESSDGRRRSAWTEPRTLLIGVVTLIAAFTEGTANDWISVGFVDGHGVPGWAGVLAFAIFLTCMTIGRLAGTRLLDTYGRVPVLRIMLVLALVGSVMVALGTPAVAYVGVAVWGIGIALGFPVGMSAAADDPERAPARLSVVSTIGYGAFLAGPPLLGMLGHEVGILRALLVVGAALIFALLCLPAVREPSHPGRDLPSEVSRG